MSVGEQDISRQQHVAAVFCKAATSRQAWRAGRLRASRPPQGKPGEPAAFGRAGRRKTRLASRPPQGEPDELAAFGRAGRPLHFNNCFVLNGFGLRPWGSPPAVALANFLLNWLKVRVSNQLLRSLLQALVCIG